MRILNEVTMVLFFMVQNIEYKNLVYITQAEIAKQLKINKSNVSKALQRLIQLKVCLPLPKPTNPTKKYHKGYVINPEFMFKGKPEEVQICNGIWNNAKQKHDDKSSTSDKSSDKINSLKSLIITKFLNTKNCIIRSKYTAIYPDKLREFIAKHGYSDSDLKLLADSGFFLRDKNQITKSVKIDGKLVRMYCISISSEVQKPKTGSENSEPVTQVFTPVTHSEAVKQLNKLLTQSEKYGGANTNNINPKLFILSYLKECSTGNGVVNTTIQEIVDTTGVSKSTIIPFLRWLQQHKFILRPKSGVIVLTKLLQKYNLPNHCSPPS